MAKITKESTLYVVKICAILLVITMCVAFLLSFVNAVTLEPIAANDDAKIAEAMGKLFTDVEGIATQKVEGDFGNTVNGFYEVRSGDTLIGYYADVAAKGFKGNGSVVLMVGLDTAGKTVGVEVITNSDTVGIGDRINSKDNFLYRFKGREGSLSYKKGAGDSEAGVVDGLSGATYSSKAVISGVDAALSAYKTYTDMKGGN